MCKELFNDRWRNSPCCLKWKHRWSTLSSNLLHSATGNTSSCYGLFLPFVLKMPLFIKFSVVNTFPNTAKQQKALNPRWRNSWEIFYSRAQCWETCFCWEILKSSHDCWSAFSSLFLWIKALLRRPNKLSYSSDRILTAFILNINRPSSNHS